ncbi:hypothetical protein DDZ14_16600 [Maritimibacter sp. 55A14]|uniref:hypothetical protein n=1 Tax=Maritimibacter sp. 55A14 TaxID=2174844 RepID=UPI000D620369|nr:hypothetical protein [Maritimibacter sp. 55A14]PWE29849.1 hypothetical protein DDZ14_16600 [Maritimibacter sp. 55A14]
MDKTTDRAYFLRMKRFLPVMPLLFLAVFAAGIITHAVSANAMALDMAIADGGAMSMADCQGCPTDNDGDPDEAACELVCTAPAMSLLYGAASAQYVTPLLGHAPPIGMPLPNGLRAPPDPFPPRSLI